MMDNTATIDMERPETSTTETVPELAVCHFRPTIENFYIRMTAERWGLLKSGTPDDATKVLLADLILELISSLTKALLKAIKSVNVIVSEESVLSSMGNTLAQSFAEVLEVEEQVESVSSACLTSLIGKEVAQSLNSALSTVRPADPILNQRITPPNRLNKMVSHACKMLRAFAGKMKILYSHPTNRQRSCQNASPREVKTEVLKSGDTDDYTHSPSVLTIEEVTPDTDDEDVELSDSDDLSQSPVKRSKPETRKVASEDSFEAATTKAVQKIISKEVREIIEPLLDEVLDMDLELLQSERSLNTESLSEEIALAISKEVKSLEATDSASPISEQRTKRKLSMEGIATMIKNFFAKHFAKAWIHRIVAQMKAKFYKGSKVESRHSVQSLINDVDSLLLPGDGEKSKGGDELCVFQGLKNTPSNKVLIFTQALSELLYTHITSRMAPEIIPERIRKRASPSTEPEDPQPHAEMYADVQNKVWSFMTLIRWWLKTQVGSHSERVKLALMDTVSLAPTPVAEASVDTLAKTEKNQVSVKLFVQKLVTRTFKKAKVNCALANTDAMIDRLCENTWAKVDGVDFDATPKTFQTLDKLVFQDLCKKWGCAEMVLVSMNLEEPALDNEIASSIKYHLTKPPRKYSTICEFLSYVGHTIANEIFWGGVSPGCYGLSHFPLI